MRTCVVWMLFLVVALFSVPAIAQEPIPDPIGDGFVSIEHEQLCLTLREQYNAVYDEYAMEESLLAFTEWLYQQALENFNQANADMFEHLLNGQLELAEMDWQMMQQYTAEMQTYMAMYDLTVERINILVPEMNSLILQMQVCNCPNLP